MRYGQEGGHDGLNIGMLVCVLTMVYDKPKMNASDAGHHENYDHTLSFLSVEKSK